MKTLFTSSVLPPGLLVLAAVLWFPIPASCQEAGAPVLNDDGPSTAGVPVHNGVRATTETLGPAGFLSGVKNLASLFPSGIIPLLKLSGSEDDVSLGKTELRRLLGDETDFVYDRNSRRDPMLLPWTHFRYTATREVADAERVLQKGQNLELAEKAFTTVLRLAARMEATGFRLRAMTGLVQKAESGLRKIEAERERRGEEARIEAMALGEIDPELPKWVRDHTEGILFSKDNPMCLVGPYILKVGDRVPLQKVNVEVTKIDEMTVTFYVSSPNSLSGKSFVVSLEEGE